jgi:hypothetical protein
MGERYYEEYLETHEKVINGTGKDKDGTCEPRLHNWYLSGARVNYYKEMKYRSWFSMDFYMIYDEAMNVIKEVESKCKNYVKYEW